MVKKVIDVHGTILLLPPFRDGDQLADVLEDFSTFVPEMAPEFWAFYEPINKKYDNSSLRQELIAVGSSDILWKRKSPPRGWGEVRRRTYPLRGPQHASHYFELSVASSPQIESCIKYLKNAAKKFGADYACCDTLSPMYKQPATMNQLSPHGGILSVYTHRLARWLPDIVWGQIFGPAYVQLFGIEKLLSAPAYKVEHMGSDMVYLQLSESMFDMYENYEQVDVVRQKVKNHLDSNIFFNPAYPQDHVYKTPHFEFTE